MAELYIAGSFLGVLLVLVLMMWINGRRKRHSSMIRAEEASIGESDTTIIEQALASPVTWTLAFLAIILVTLGAAFAILMDLAGATETIGGLFGALFVGFIAYNVYAVARNRGHSNALSVAEAAFVLGLFAIAGVAAFLITG